MSSKQHRTEIGISMRSLNIIALVFVSTIAYGCGNSTPPAESPEPAAATEEAPAEAPVGDAGAPAL